MCRMSVVVEPSPLAEGSILRRTADDQEQCQFYLVRLFAYKRRSSICI